MGWLLFILAWGGYYLLHSMLAGEQAKQWVKKNTPKGYPLYRIGYNLLFIIGLGLLIFWTVIADHEFILPRNLWMIITGVILTGIGSLLLILSVKNYNLKEFAGISALKNNATEPTKEKLIITGLNQCVRHPLYLSLYILFTGIGLIHPAAHTWVAIGVSFIYLPLGIWSEEKKLIAYFGEDYKKYRKTTPAIFPFLPW